MHRRLIALVVVPILVAGLVGCGSEDDGTADAPTSGAAGQTPAEAEVPDDLCSLITAAELSAALGATVTTTVGPSGDCEFDQEDPRALSGNVGVVAYADVNGGFEGYVTGLDASIKEATSHDLDGVGDAAVIKVGLSPMGSGENLMAGGVADRGGFLLQVTLVQAQQMSEQDLVDAAGAVLRVADDKTS